MAAVDAESSRLLSGEKPLLCSLSSLPMELIVYLLSFVTSARDKVILRYVSQRLRAAVESSPLWRNFTWSHFDVREENSLRSLFESCGCVGRVKAKTTYNKHC